MGNLKALLIKRNKEKQKRQKAEYCQLRSASKYTGCEKNINFNI